MIQGWMLQTVILSSLDYNGCAEGKTLLPKYASLFGKMIQKTFSFFTGETET
jgi:hypothetical protein